MALGNGSLKNKKLGSKKVATNEVASGKKARKLEESKDLRVKPKDENITPKKNSYFTSKRKKEEELDSEGYPKMTPSLDEIAEEERRKEERKNKSFFGKKKSKQEDGVFGGEDEVEEVKTKPKKESKVVEKPVKKIKPKKEKKPKKDKDSDYYEENPSDRMSNPFKKKKKSLFLGGNKISEAQARDFKTEEIVVPNSLAYSEGALLNTEYSRNNNQVEIGESIDDLLTENVYVVADSEQMSDFGIDDEIINKTNNLELGVDLGLQLQQLLGSVPVKETKEKVESGLSLDELLNMDLEMGEAVGELPNIEDMEVEELTIEDSLEELDFEEEPIREDFHDISLESLEEVSEESRDILKVFNDIVEEPISDFDSFDSIDLDTLNKFEEDLSEINLDNDFDELIDESPEVDDSAFNINESIKETYDSIDEDTLYKEVTVDELLASKREGFPIPNSKPLIVTSSMEEEVIPKLSFVKHDKEVREEPKEELYEEEKMSFGKNSKVEEVSDITLTYDIDDIRKVHVPLSVRTNELESLNKLDTSKALNSLIQTKSTPKENSKDTIDILDIFNVEEGSK